MSQHLVSAIDTANRNPIAAGGSAPGMEVNGAMGGALIVGLIIAAIIITRWRDKKYSDSERKSIILAIVMTICLYGGSGIVGSLMGTVKSTADQTGTTLTQTSVGR